MCIFVRDLNIYKYKLEKYEMLIQCRSMVFVLITFNIFMKNNLFSLKFLLEKFMDLFFLWVYILTSYNHIHIKKQ